MSKALLHARGERGNEGGPLTLNPGEYVRVTIRPLETLKPELSE